MKKMRIFLSIMLTLLCLSPASLGVVWDIPDEDKPMKATVKKEVKK